MGVWPVVESENRGCRLWARRPARRSEPKRQTWTVRAQEIWEQHKGGLLQFGRLGKALKPLVEKHGEEAVLKAWDQHVKGEPTYASPENFAREYGKWAGTVKPISSQPSVEGNADYSRYGLE